jgi:hypothetical protein
MRKAVNRRTFVLSAKRELTPEGSTGHYPNRPDFYWQF